MPHLIQFNTMDIKKILEESEIAQDWKELFITKKDAHELIDKTLSKHPNFCPNEEDIFNVYKTPLNKIKVVILGQDPYPKKEDATGLAFEVNGYKSWQDTTSNTSIINILKELYYTKTGKVETISNIRAAMASSDFKILPPNQLFKKWTENGVYLLNTALTCAENEPDSHINIWNEITLRTITKIAEKDEEIIWLLWGKRAQNLKPIINLFENNLILENVHPALNEFVGKNTFKTTIEKYCTLS